MTKKRQAPMITEEEFKKAVNESEGVRVLKKADSMGLLSESGNIFSQPLLPFGFCEGAGKKRCVQRCAPHRRGAFDDFFPLKPD